MFGVNIVISSAKVIMSAHICVLVCLLCWNSSVISETQQKSTQLCWLLGSGFLKFKNNILSKCVKLLVKCW